MAFVVGIVLTVGLIAVGALYLQQLELKQLRRWVAGRGWTVLDPPRGGPWLRALPDRGRGQLRLVAQASLPTGRGAVPLMIAWYRWETSRASSRANSPGTNRSTHNATVFVLAAPRPLPNLAITSRGLGSSIAHSLGWSLGPDTGLPAFDDRFRVDTEAGRAAVLQLPPELLEAMLAGQVPPWTSQDGQLVVWSTDLTTPEEIDGALLALGRLVDLLGGGGGQWSERSAG